MAAGDGIRLERDDGVAHLVLDAPPVNKFTTELLRAVLDAVESLGEETGALVVSSSTPAVFAAGGDIGFMARAPLAEQERYVELCQRAYSAFERVACPSIAAVEGACLAGGLELALACDVRVVGASATLGLPEANVGILPGAGGTQRLPRAIGQGAARDMLITGRRIDGREAGALGLASRVVADGEAVERALALARELADGAREAIRAIKRLAVAAPDVEIETGLARERAEWAAVRRAPSAQEGLDAFAEKRAPDFRGASGG